VAALASTAGHAGACLAREEDKGQNLKSPLAFGVFSAEKEQL
jgi:hypothetical protein